MHKNSKTCTRFPTRWGQWMAHIYPLLRPDCMRRITTTAKAFIQSFCKVWYPPNACSEIFILVGRVRCTTLTYGLGLQSASTARHVNSHLILWLAMPRILIGLGCWNLLRATKTNLHEKNIIGISFKAPHACAWSVLSGCSKIDGEYF